MFYQNHKNTRLELLNIFSSRKTSNQELLPLLFMKQAGCTGPLAVRFAASSLTCFSIFWLVLSVITSYREPLGL